MPAIISIPLFIALGWLWTAMLAVPAWLLWSTLGLGMRYFSFLPPPWPNASLFDIAALFLMFAVLRTAVSPITFQFKLAK